MNKFWAHILVLLGVGFFLLFTFSSFLNSSPAESLASLEVNGWLKLDAILGFVFLAGLSIGCFLGAAKLFFKE